LDKVGDEGVGAGGVVGRVREGEDVLICAEGEAFNLAKGGVLQFLAQQFAKVGAAGFVSGKGEAKTFDGGGGAVGRVGCFGEKGSLHGYLQGGIHEGHEGHEEKQKLLKVFKNLCVLRAIRGFT